MALTSTWRDKLALPLGLILTKEEVVAKPIKCTDCGEVIEDQLISIQITSGPESNMIAEVPLIHTELCIDCVTRGFSSMTVGKLACMLRVFALDANCKCPKNLIAPLGGSVEVTAVSIGNDIQKSIITMDKDGWPVCCGHDMKLLKAGVIITLYSSPHGGFHIRDAFWVQGDMYGCEHCSSTVVIDCAEPFQYPSGGYSDGIVATEFGDIEWNPGVIIRLITEPLGKQGGASVNKLVVQL